MSASPGRRRIQIEYSMKVSQFHEACKAADFSALESLLSQSPTLINSLDPKYGWTPLCRALICSQSEVARFLLKKGADANIKTAVGEPPLYLAVDLQQEGVARMLLEFGADPNCSNADGETPLHVATFKGQLSVMELLLSSGADPELRDSVVLPT